MQIGILGIFRDIPVTCISPISLNIPDDFWISLDDFWISLGIFKGFWRFSRVAIFEKVTSKFLNIPDDFDDFWISLGLLFWRFWRFSRAAVFKHLRKKFIEKPSLQHIQYLYFLNIVDFVIGYACMVGSPLFKMIKLYNYVEFNVVDRTVTSHIEPFDNNICFDRTVIL